jgi:hypothetical protein
MGCPGRGGGTGHESTRSIPEPPAQRLGLIVGHGPIPKWMRFIEIVRSQEPAALLNWSRIACAALRLPG